MTAPYLPPLIVVESEQKPAGGSLALMTGVTGATALFDVLTTLRGARQGYTEQNPIARAFVEAGTVPTLAYITGVTTAQALLANELKKQGKSWWWVPQAATAALHLTAGILNQRRLK